MVKMFQSINGAKTLLTIIFDQKTIHSFPTSLIQVMVPLAHFWKLSPDLKVFQPG